MANPALVSGPLVFGFQRNVAGTWQNSAGTLFTPPSAFARNVWQSWEVDYTVGASTLTLTIDGTTATIPTSITAVDTTTPYRLVIFANGPDRPVYLDAVPEPSTFALAALGVGMLVFRFRKSRIG